MVATVHCRGDMQKWSFGHSHLTSDEARRIAKAIARIPEFMMQRKGFYARGPGSYRWSMARPFHVAFEDSYVRANWDGINALCRFNSIPFDATGEKIRRERPPACPSVPSLFLGPSLRRVRRGSVAIWLAAKATERKFRRSEHTRRKARNRSKVSESTERT